MPTEAEKIAALQLIPNPRVAELVLVDWPAPDGPIYYATVFASDLVASAPVTPIEYRLPGNVFMDVPHEAGIADDKVDLDFSDLDDEISRLVRIHGSGSRVEIFYWFPEVELLYSEWWGHLRQPDECDRERFKAPAEFGFLSALLPLPRRAFFTGCQAVFGGTLRSQEEISEGDCPYSRHLGNGVPSTRFGTDNTWKRHASPPDGWMLPGFDDSAWSAAFEVGAYGVQPWTNKAAFPASTPAKWIWDSDTRGNFTIAPSVLYFRKEFTADDVDALLVVTADDGFVAYLDGVQILVGSDWQQSWGKSLTLVEGQTYCLAIKGINNAFISGVIAELAFGITALGFGELDPATSQPYTKCPRNNREACTARLGDSLSFLAFDTIIDSHVVNETSGPNITVTSRGNENNLKRPLRVIAGTRHVSDLDVLAYTVEPNTNHPDQGSVRALMAACEGPVRSITNFKINGDIIGAQHLNVRYGENRQPATAFSANVNNYSGTALCLGVTMGDFTKASASDLRGEADIVGLRNVRIYSDETTFTEDTTDDRAWWLMHAMRNKRWGYGLDLRRLIIQDFINASRWFKETVSVKGVDGVTSTGPRSTFNAEFIERSAQQQIEDICRSGRLGLPYADHGKMRVTMLRRASELFSTTLFIDRGFWAVFDRAPDAGEVIDWTTALEGARAISAAALRAEGADRLDSLFEHADYTARARTDSEYVFDLYQAFFNRPPDDAGATYWLAQVVNVGRAAVLAAFDVSAEFAARMQDQPVPTFTDLSDGEIARNICVEGETQKSTLTWSEQSDAELPNRVMLTLDDAAHDNQQRPLPFEDPAQQFKAGRAAGDFNRRVVEKQYTAFGITDAGEAARLGNTLLALGEFDEGGVENNLRVQFVTWWAHAVTLRKYQIIRIISVEKLHERGDGRRFDYFRIRSIRRMPDLKVEISAQAYPVEYYEQLELITTPPEIAPSDIDDNPGGGRGRIPWKIPFIELDHSDDRIRFRLGMEE